MDNSRFPSACDSGHVADWCIVQCRACGEEWEVWMYYDLGCFHPRDENDWVCPNCGTDEDTEVVA